MSHPSAIDLEAFACGEPVPGAEEHVATCDACRAFVARARGMKPRANVELLLAGARRQERNRRIVRAASVAFPLAVAVAVSLVLARGSTTRPSATPVAQSGDEGALDEGALALAPTADPDTTLKGGIQLAVVRARGAAQERYTDAVRVRPGDRLRLEVAIDRPQSILGAVLGDDGTYVELMMEGVRDAGTHLSEKSVRVDQTRTSGTILVGTPDAVHRARSTHSFEHLRTLRVEWERDQ
jgi:hypothetical protein